MKNIPWKGRGQGHVSNFYIVDLENFTTASRRYADRPQTSCVYHLRWYTQLVCGRFVYDTSKTMEATRSRHGWVHMFITHWPIVTLHFITSICSGLVVQVVSALLRDNWQDFNWHYASRVPSAIAELLVYIHDHTVSAIIKGCPYSITERRVPELIPVLGCQPAGDVNHKPGGRLPLLSARLAVTRATLKSAATMQFCCLVNRGTMGVNRSWAMPPFHRVHMTSYSTLIEMLCELAVLDFECCFRAHQVCKSFPNVFHELQTWNAQPIIINFLITVCLFRMLILFTSLQIFFSL